MKKMINWVLYPDADNYLAITINAIVFALIFPLLLPVMLIKGIIDSYNLRKRAQLTKEHIAKIKAEQQEWVRDFKEKTKRKYEKESAEFMRQAQADLQEQAYKAGDVVDIECEVVE